MRKATGPMLKMVATGAAAVVVVVAAGLAYAASQPDRFQVQRSVVIGASAERVFPLINDLRAFNGWNPFERGSPAAEGRYEGPPAGRGASYAFDRIETGSGRLEIVDIAPPSRVTMRLSMVRPMHADNRVTFVLQPGGDSVPATTVTWALDGEVPFLGKVMHLVLGIDKMIGRKLEAGLADLKVLAELRAEVGR